MTVTSGFFNSVNHDRKYNAEEISSIFDGIILDGVYQGFGEAFKIEGTSTANQVKIGAGRAWFNHTWTLNDEALYLTLPAPNSTYPRIDAIVLEVNNSSSVRANTIKYISGTAASSPTKPTLTNTTDVHQYPLAYITRPKGDSTISAGNIENSIGSTSCPIVTGVLEVLSDDRFIAQTIANLTTDFNTWFDGIKDTLDENTAANLLNKINENYDELSKKTQTNADNIYRLTVDSYDVTQGRNLGSSVTSDQLNSIKNFDRTIYPGDYWVINGIKYLIMGYNLLGDFKLNGKNIVSGNHAIVIPLQTVDISKNITQKLYSKANNDMGSDLYYLDGRSGNFASNYTDMDNRLTRYVNIKDQNGFYDVPDSMVSSIASAFGESNLKPITYINPNGILNCEYTNKNVLFLDAYLTNLSVSYDYYKNTKNETNKEAPWIVDSGNSGIPQTPLASLSSGSPYIPSYNKILYDMSQSAHTKIPIATLKKLIPNITDYLLNYIKSNMADTSDSFSTNGYGLAGYSELASRLMWIPKTKYTYNGSLKNNYYYYFHPSNNYYYEYQASDANGDMIIGEPGWSFSDKTCEQAACQILSIPYPYSSNKTGISNVKYLNKSGDEVGRFLSTSSSPEKIGHNAFGYGFRIKYGETVDSDVSESATTSINKIFKNSAYMNKYVNNKQNLYIYTADHATYTLTSSAYCFFCL